MRPQRQSPIALVAIVIGCLACGVSSLYLPGIVPVDFEEGDPIEIFATKVNSNINKVPYDYESLPFCPAPVTPMQSKALAHGGLGATFTGERRRRTGYHVRMKTNSPCSTLCTRTLSAPEIRTLVRRIRQRYRVHLSADGMPAVQYAAKPTAFELGYALGHVEGGTNETVYLATHLTLRIVFHSPELTASEKLSLFGGASAHRVVGFEVSASSGSGPQGACDPNAAPFVLPSDVERDSALTVAFTYTVEFERSDDIEWASRWDPLFKASPERRKVQWFALSNGILLGAFMTALIALILLRTVYRDFRRYNVDANDEVGLLDEDFAAETETGWKILRGDVFRAPPTPALLAVAVGAGSQLLAMVLVTLVFASLGAVSSSRRGSFLVAMVFVWIATSSLSGFVASRLYRNFGGNRWKVVVVGVALVFPGIVFGTFLSLNLLLWLLGSIGAAPALTVVLLLFLWIGVSVPLTYIGGFVGQTRKLYEFPVRTNTVPRDIPLQPFYLGIPVYMAAGALPFGVICLELLYIMNSLWQNEVYSMFGFLFVVYLLVVVISGETSVVVVYLKLVHEDYRWWWQGFGAAGFSAAYVFLYSLVYLFTIGDLDQGNIASIILYISYMGLLSVLFGVATGAVGFLSSFWFVRKIFSAIRAD